MIRKHYYLGALLAFGLAAAGYFVLAYVGLSFEIVPSVTLVWPPVGWGISLLYVFRRRWVYVILGVGVGAYAINLYTTGNAMFAMSTFGGNTLAISVAFFVLHNLGFRPNDMSARNVLLLVPVGFFASWFSATSGAIVGLDAGRTVWSFWMVGDLVGFVIFTPAFLWGLRKYILHE